MPLIRLFLDIALFNKGPQDGPESRLLLLLAVLGNFAVGLGLSLMEIDWVDAVAQSVVGIALLAGFLWGALSLSSKRPRFLQTATAAFGCDTLISALAVPLLVSMQLIPEAIGLASIFLAFLLFWQVAVVAHILRHALSIPFISGLGLALAYTVVSYGIIMALFPQGG